MRHACLVYNPIAGRYPSSLLAQRAAGLLREGGWEIDIQQSLSGPHITELARQAAASNLDAFFVMGGDGSVNLAATGLLHSDTALGVLPAGTTNVWAQELGLTSLGRPRKLCVEESAIRQANAVVRRVDVGLCNERAFLLWAGIGLDAFIVHRLEPRSRLEKYLAIPSYAMKAAWSASLWHGMNLEAEVDGKLIKGHFLLGVVSNIRRYAGGLAILSPQAQIDDGIMDLWLFKGENMLGTVQVALEVIARRHARSNLARLVTFRQLRIPPGSRMFVQLDGEPYSSDTGITIEVAAAGLPVLVPQHTAHPL
jgi:YegS/Rv2252/BmrU family lipid kinase